MQGKKANTVVIKHLSFFQHYWTSLRIHGDSYERLVSDKKLMFYSVNHFQSKGLIERFHAALAEMIPIYCSLFRNHLLHNTKDNIHGFTAYEVIFRYTYNRTSGTLYNQRNLISKYVPKSEPNRVFLKIAWEKISHETEKSKARFNRKVQDKRSDYKVGYKVNVKEYEIKINSEKIFNATFQITEILQNFVILLNTQKNQTSLNNFVILKPILTVDIQIFRSAGNDNFPQFLWFNQTVG